VAIVLYIIVYVIGYNCKHLAKVSVTGIARLTIQQPTMNCNPMDSDCDSDFKTAAQLPYCNHTRNPTAEKQLECKYEDGVDLTAPYPVPGTFFVHTRISRLSQTRDCDPTKVTDGGCHGTIYRSQPGAKIEDESYYLADMEDFTLLFGHGFKAVNADTGEVKQGQGVDLTGYVDHSPGDANGGALVDRHSIPDDDHFPSMHKIKNLGDIISVHDLMGLAGQVSGLDTLRGEKNDSIRWNGCVLHVRIEYSNKAHFDVLAREKPFYVMTANLLPISEFKKMYGKRSEDGTTRVVHDVHGVLVVTEITGFIRMISVNELLTVLTTSVALFAVARLVVDNVMVSCSTHRKRYGILQKQVAHDFDDLDHNHDLEDGQTSDSDRNESYLKDGSMKGHFTTALLRDYAEKGVSPVGDDLLHVLLTFEKRLNHLDAVDIRCVTASLDQGEDSISDRLQSHWSRKLAKGSDSDTGVREMEMEDS